MYEQIADKMTVATDKAANILRISDHLDLMVSSAWQYSINILLALLILWLGWWAADCLSRLLRRGLERANVDPTLRPVLSSILLWVIRVITVIAVLSQFGVQTASIIAILGAAGLAIGLALQGTLQNIAAGMMLLLLRPFHVGEYIESGEIQGTVEEIGLFVTKLVKVDGVFLFVPNNQLWNSSLTNYSRNEFRRIDLPVTLRHNDNVAAAISAMQKLLRTDERILKTLEPLVAVDTIQEGSTVLKVRYWTKNDDFWTVRWEIGEKIPKALHEVGCAPAVPLRLMLTPDEMVRTTQKK